MTFPSSKRHSVSPMTDADADAPSVTIRWEYLPEIAADSLSNRESAPGQLVQIIAQIVGQAAPHTRVVISGDFVQSVEDNFASRGIRAGGYDRDRGGNVVSAKTMRNADGHSTIYFAPELIFGFEGESETWRTMRFRLVAFTAAHEVAHALHRERGEDSEATFYALNPSTAEDQHYITAAGTVIEEYRAQLAAESISSNPSDFTENIRSDLDALQAAVVEARRLAAVDVYQAARLHDKAMTVFVKGLALSAAEIRARRVDATPLPTDHPLWAMYAAPIYDQLEEVLGQLPDGYKRATLPLLGGVTKALFSAFRTLEANTGIDHVWAGEQEMMFWKS